MNQQTIYNLVGVEGKVSSAAMLAQRTLPKESKVLNVGTKVLYADNSSMSFIEGNDDKWSAVIVHMNNYSFELLFDGVITPATNKELPGPQNSYNMIIDIKKITCLMFRESEDDDDIKTIEWKSRIDKKNYEDIQMEQERQQQQLNQFSIGQPITWKTFEYFQNQTYITHLFGTIESISIANKTAVVKDDKGRVYTSVNLLMSNIYTPPKHQNVHLK